MGLNKKFNKIESNKARIDETKVPNWKNIGSANNFLSVSPETEYRLFRLQIIDFNDNNDYNDSSIKINGLNSNYNYTQKNGNSTSSGSKFPLGEVDGHKGSVWHFTGNVNGEGKVVIENQVRPFPHRSIGNWIKYGYLPVSNSITKIEVSASACQIKIDGYNL